MQRKEVVLVGCESFREYATKDEMINDLAGYTASIGYKETVKGWHKAVPKVIENLATLFQTLLAACKPPLR